MNEFKLSLLTYLDAPVMVGDPEGLVTYLNPAFERCFGVDSETGVGLPMAALFEGGAREAMLTAVMDACRLGSTSRFRVRHERAGYGAVSSPITVGGRSVGVVILLTPSVSEDERCLGLQRELADTIRRHRSCFEGLMAQSRDTGAPGCGAMALEGLRALDRMEEIRRELLSLLASTKQPATIDPIPASPGTSEIKPPGAVAHSHRGSDDPRDSGKGTR